MQRLFRTICAIILLFAAFEILSSRSSWSTEGHHSEVTPVEADHALNPKDPIRDALEKKREELKLKEQSLLDREEHIKMLEKELEEKRVQLERLRATLSADSEHQRKNAEERVVKTVSVFESMTPKAAASVMEVMEDQLAVDVLKRMDTKKVGKILAGMEKNRSARLAELAAGYPSPAADRKTSSLKPAGQEAESKPASQAQPALPKAVESKKGGKP